MWEAEWSCVCFFLSLCCCKSVQSCLSLCLSLCFCQFCNFTPFPPFYVFLFCLPLSCVHIFDVSVCLKQALCVSVGSHCTPEYSECGSNSQTPSLHCQVISVKPGVSPTEPGGTDLPSTGFHLCLNATALKAHTYNSFIMTNFLPLFSIL